MTRKNRRAFLGSVAATVAIGAAGCLGGGSNDDSGTPESSDGMAGSTDGAMAETTDAMDGMADGSPTDGSMTDSGMGDDGTGADGMAGDGTTETSAGTGGESADGGMAGTDAGAMETTTFEVTVENVSEPGSITTSEGAELAVPLSPTAYAVHAVDGYLFADGEAASDGLESLAEDGAPGILVEEVAGREGTVVAGAATTPAGADAAGPLMPGDSYTFEVEAAPGHRLSLATMFVQSNDLFYAPDPAGTALFADGEPVSGDVTDALSLWDAGTERNREPGIGPDQAPRQSGPDSGPGEDGVVRPVSRVMDGYEYPDVDEVVAVTVATT